MKVKMETITPEIAKAYLALSTGNRSMKTAKVASYARDMARGAWRENGETIIFGSNGDLLDGHHRLTACVKSQSDFCSLVVRGVSPDANKTIDMGASRTVGDALSFHGYRNANNINAIVAALVSLKNERPRSANLSADEVFRFISDFPEVEQAAIVSSRKHLPRSQAIIGAIWAVAKINGEEETANAFLEVLSYGIPSMPRCAAHALRERLMRDAISSKKLSLQDVHRLAVHAWEKFRIGEPVKHLKIPTDYAITGW